jgi:hypothetical protein
MQLLMDKELVTTHSTLCPTTIVAAPVPAAAAAAAAAAAVAAEIASHCDRGGPVNRAAMLAAVASDTQANDDVPSFVAPHGAPAVIETVIVHSNTPCKYAGIDAASGQHELLIAKS